MQQKPVEQDTDIIEYLLQTSLQAEVSVPRE